MEKKELMLVKVTYPSLTLLVGAIFLFEPVQNHPLMLMGFKSGRSQPSKSQSLKLNGDGSD